CSWHQDLPRISGARHCSRARRREPARIAGAILPIMRYAWATVAGLLMTSCAVSGPSVTVLPGQGKSFDQFQKDDGTCRGLAVGQDQRGYDMTYVQCMYANGHRVPVIGSYPYTGDPSSQPQAQPPANIPPPPQGTPPAPPPGVGR